MTRPNHRRWTLVVGASVAAHAGLLVLLAFNAPRLRVQAPPDQVFEVTVVPRYLSPEKLREAQRAPVQVRPLTPRRLLPPEEPLPVAPLVTPNAPAPSSDQNSAFHPAPNPPGPRDQLRNALRGSPAGCASADSVILNKAERENCLERFGKGAKNAPFIEPPMSRDKRRAFDEAAARKERMREYKAAPVPPGLAGSTAPGGITGLGEGPRLRDFGK